MKVNQLFSKEIKKTMVVKKKTVNLAPSDGNETIYIQPIKREANISKLKCFIDSL